jgi:hypothetical protein
MIWLIPKLLAWLGLWDVRFFTWLLLPPRMHREIWDDARFCRWGHHWRRIEHEGFYLVARCVHCECEGLWRTPVGP